MKKSVTELLDGCQPQELDGLLANIDCELPDEDDAGRLARLAGQKAGIVQKHGRVRRAMLIAACIALVAAVLVGCYVAEKVEYDQAVKFFDLNDFDTEGFSREDIKRVYRDITTESFSYDKSCALIERARDVTTVEGVDIRIMNTANNHLNFNSTAEGWSNIFEKGVSYVYDNDGGTDEGGNYNYYKNAYIEKYLDGVQEWRADFESDIYIGGYDVRDGRVLIWGDDMYDTRRNRIHTAVALVDDQDGTILWEQTLDSPYAFDEYGFAALGEGGRIAVLTIAYGNRFADEGALVFRELDVNGEVVTEHVQETQNLAFMIGRQLTKLSDGWLAELWYSADADGSDPVRWEPRLVKFNFDGEIVNEWTLTDDSENGYRYEVASVTEHQGALYVSTQARPNESVMYADDSMDYDSFGFDNYTDEWRDRAREEFSSVLFVLDSGSGKPVQFYTVGGTFPAGALSGGGADFSTDEDGNLVWHVGRIIRCGYSPFTSSFTFYGITRMYDYTFDSGQNILRQEKTDRFGFFRTV